MKTHTSNFKEQIKLIGKEIDSRITFGSTVLGKNDLNAVTPSYQGAILKSVMKQLDIDSNVAIPIGTNLKYEFGLKVNGEYEYINYGNYVVYNIEKQEDTNSYKIVCYDKLLYSMLDYVKLPITYPISVRDYINAISTTLGLKFANKSGTFANYDKQIQSDLYDGLGYTFRDVLDELAQVTASTICLNNNDELEIRYITETGDTIDEEFLKDVNVNFGEKFGAVNTIVLSRSGDSDSVYYPEVLPANPYEIKISDNQIMNGNDRADFLPDIYNKLNGLEFYTNDFVSTGIIYYDLCDRYSVKVGDNTYSCVMLNDEILVTQGLEENIYTELPEQTETDYKKADTTDRRINQAYAILDKQNKKFEVLVSEVTSNEEKIASLEITTGNISTKVSTVENSLSTTNTNLSNLSNTVNTLSDDIDGVSADFEDFKDNEYIQSIDNLQKQIDGAIQFWNGAEIPTINNYPANQWTTENDKINHQADIYTVVQDVQGEMKQGKSYRFDKVNGVWQWIELTDNELSAVQALAQEALDKAKANATEIGTVKTRVSSLEQTDEQIKASVESIDKKIIPTANISGSNIYVEDASDNPLVKLEIEGKSKQETRNKNNIFAGSMEVGSISGVDGSATYSTTRIRSMDFIEVQPNTTYMLSATGTNLMLFVFEYASDGTYIKRIPANWATEIPFSFTTSSTTEKIKFIFAFEDDTTITTSDVTNIELYEPILPSPDYPSEIESVGNSYENLFNKDSVENGYRLGSDGTPFAESGYWLSDYIAVKKLENYVYSRKGVGGSQAYAFYDENKNFISRNFMPNTSTIYISTTENTKYIRITDLNESLEIAQLEEGLIIHPYISYGKYGIEVEIIGKNLFDESSITENYLYEDGGVFTPATTYNTSDYISCKSNEFIVSAKFTAYNPYIRYIVAEFDENKTYIQRQLNSNSSSPKYTFKLNDNTKYIRLCYRNDATLYDIQIEEGSVATEYEQYQERTSTIVLNAPLRSLPNGVKDIAYIRNGKLYVDRYVGSVVLNGSEWWGYNKMINNYGYYTPISDAKRVYETTISKNNILCSHYIVTRPDWQWNSTAGTVNCALNTGSEPTVRFTNGEATNELEEFKTWLSTNNTQIDYELATPVTEEIGEIEMPSTFKGVNHISTTDNLEPTLNIEYVRDTTLSNYVEGQINKVMTIEKRHYSELVIEDDKIEASVESVNSSLNGLNTTINRVEEITNDNSQVINVISTNIDRTSGEVREVTTTTGFTFNADGMTIDDGSGFKAEHTANGTYYKDGNSIVGQYTKDGSKQKDLELFGTYSYGKESIDDTPMFVGQLYTDANGERGFGHFYNGEG